jgi:hypothetical protein
MALGIDVTKDVLFSKHRGRAAVNRCARRLRALAWPARSGPGERGKSLAVAARSEPDSASGTEAFPCRPHDPSADVVGLGVGQRARRRGRAPVDEPAYRLAPRPGRGALGGLPRRPSRQRPAITLLCQSASHPSATCRSPTSRLCIFLAEPGSWCAVHVQVRVALSGTATAGGAGSACRS